MRKDLSDITIVVDRSGSMAICKDDAENGINHFISEQKKLPGSAIFSLVQFDTVYEFVHKGRPIADVTPFTLVPRGMTALLDAVGRSIVEAGERLKDMAEADRPGLVAFVIVTDGAENSSKEFTKEKIKEMIEHQQNVYKWQFTFLGANQDAFAEAAQMGISMMAAANFSPQNAARAYGSASSNVARMRRMAATGGTVVCSYTPEEKASMAG